MASQSDKSVLKNNSIRGLAVVLAGLLGGCAGGFEIPGLGTKKDLAYQSVRQPLSKATIPAAATQSRQTAQTAKKIGTLKPNSVGLTQTATARANALPFNVQLASADVTNSGFYAGNYEHGPATSPQGDVSSTGSKGAPELTSARLAVSKRYLQVDSPETGNWWEEVQTAERLEAERSLIASTQLAKEASKPGGNADDLETLSKKSANPLSDLWMLWTQNDYTRFEGDVIPGHEYVNSTKFQPVMSFPILDKKWNLIVRPVLQFQSVPLDEDVGNLVGVSRDTIAGDPGLLATASDPFGGRTNGLGDSVLLTLAGPNRLDGFIWGVGATQMFPTATSDVLGSKKYSAGPAALIARMAPNVGGFNFGMLPQHWWSIAGDDDRQDLNLTDIQYFINYRLSETELVGMSPNIRINWNDGIDDGLTFPVGLGYSNITFLGKLPVRYAAEVQYSVVSPDKAGSEWNFRLMFVPIIPRLFGG